MQYLYIVNLTHDVYLQFLELYLSLILTFFQVSED